MESYWYGKARAVPNVEGLSYGGLIERRSSITCAAGRTSEKERAPQPRSPLFGDQTIKASFFSQGVKRESEKILAIKSSDGERSVFGEIDLEEFAVGRYVEAGIDPVHFLQILAPFSF